MYVFVNGLITVSASAPAGFTITSDIKDLLDDLKAEKVTGSYALSCEALSDVRNALEDGAALAALGVDDDYQEEVENLHSALVDRERQEAFEE